MVSAMEDKKLTLEDPEAKACELISELSNSMDNMEDSMIEEMNDLTDPSSELLSVKMHQRFLKQQFNDLISSTVLLLDLNSQLEELIKGKEELKQYPTTLKSKTESEMHCSNNDLQVKKADENLEMFKKTDGDESSQAFDDTNESLSGKDDDYDDQEHDYTVGESSNSVYQFSFPLTRKLKLIKHYILPNSSDHVQLEAPTSSSAMQLKFNWLKYGRDVKDIEIVDSELRVNNKGELKYMIQELMIERCKEVAKAEADGKLSYFQWLLIDKNVEIWTLHLIHAKIIEIGNRLCSHLCDLMFFVSKNSREQGRWKILEEILKLLMQLQQKDTKIIKRVVSVIEKAESLLMTIGKYNPLGDGDDDYEDDEEKEIDKDFDIIFREVLCLESILSYPSLSSKNSFLVDELIDVQIGVGECDKEVDKIGSKVYAWKTHLLYEKPREEQLMEKFQATLKLWIDSQWKSLEYEP